jgi:hypothetical protein
MHARIATLYRLPNKRFVGTPHATRNGRDHGDFLFMDLKW